eukprot:GHVN01057240.1.p1 GENE.GHVN01057240.1~~GHVN01057240.1.p1  ORF type:complete len:162 (+),score=17.00 GHVN01057240.1:107-592(+)
MHVAHILSIVSITVVNSGSANDAVVDFMEWMERQKNMGCEDVVLPAINGTDCDDAGEADVRSTMSTIAHGFGVEFTDIPECIIGLGTSRVDDCYLIYTYASYSDCGIMTCKAELNKHASWEYAEAHNLTEQCNEALYQQCGRMSLVAGELNRLAKELQVIR